MWKTWHEFWIAWQWSFAEIRRYRTFLSCCTFRWVIHEQEIQQLQSNMWQIGQSSFEIVVGLLPQCEILNWRKIFKSRPDRFVRRSKHLDDQIDLADLTRAWKKWPMNQQFTEDATDSPHVCNEVQKSFQHSTGCSSTHLSQLSAVSIPAAAQAADTKVLLGLVSSSLPVHWTFSPSRNLQFSDNLRPSSTDCSLWCLDEWWSLSAGTAGLWEAARWCISLQTRWMAFPGCPTVMRDLVRSIRALNRFSPTLDLRQPPSSWQCFRDCKSWEWWFLAVKRWRSLLWRFLCRIWRVLVRRSCWFACLWPDRRRHMFLDRADWVFRNILQTGLLLSKNEISLGFDKEIEDSTTYNQIVAVAVNVVWMIFQFLC